MRMPYPSDPAPKESADRSRQIDEVVQFAHNFPNISPWEGQGIERAGISRYSQMYYNHLRAIGRSP